MNNVMTSGHLPEIRKHRFLRDPEVWRVALVASFALMLVCAIAVAFYFVKGQMSLNQSKQLLVESEKLLDEGELNDASATFSEGSMTLSEGTSLSVTCSSWAIAGNTFALASKLFEMRMERLEGEESEQNGTHDQ